MATNLGNIRDECNPKWRCGLSAGQLKAAITPARLLDETGRLVRGAPTPDAEALAEGYRKLVFARRLNEQAGALVRQGRLAVYPSSRGQEACQVACASVLAEGDWLFPTYRDSAAIAARGVDPVEVLTLLRGDWHCGYDPNEHKVAPQATPLATQLLHAVGVGHAARLKGEDTVVMALCGDGATSEGDFHEACNFAAVFRAPVVFFVQNNKYAISVPLARQSVAPSLAVKAIGYGMPGVRVDGNDLPALEKVLGEAVARARAGDGPTLVEADTYRIESHTNADDASRYRADDEVTEWLPRDPLLRVRTYLTAIGALDDDREQAIAAAAEEMAAAVRAGVGAETVADPEEVFTHVYSTLTPQLAEQRAALRAELELEEA
jgi:2-oxoisovalerate dehydrogenase E1 component alpha subunit